MVRRKVNEDDIKSIIIDTLNKFKWTIDIEKGTITFNIDDIEFNGVEMDKILKAKFGIAAS
jgi:hypothetical protein